MRDGDQLRPASWERAIAVAKGLARHGGSVAAIVGGETTNEEALMLGRVMRDGLGSHDIDSRVGGTLPLGLLRTLARPDLQATVPDLEFAHTVLLLDADPVDDAPILDLRIRKGARRNGVSVLVGSSRPTALDPRAAQAVRHAPGSGASLALAIDAFLADDRAGAEAHAKAAGADPQAVADLAFALRDGGEDVVIVWGERLTDGPAGAAAAGALVSIAERRGLAGREGAGLIELPRGTNGRGLREVGALPNAAPGLGEPARIGRDSQAIAEAAASGEVTALWLLHSDPTRDGIDGAVWAKALASAGLVVAHASTLSPELAEHANVVFPAQAGAEREGTVTHPDGRIQRLRKAIGGPTNTLPASEVIAAVAEAAGFDHRVPRGAAATAELGHAVGFYAGITTDEIGGTGVRWQEREAAASLPAGEIPADLAAPQPALSPNGSLLLGAYRSIWASPEVSISPALKFLARTPTIELSPADAERIGIAQGGRVRIAADGLTVAGTAAIRSDVPEGSVFVEDGLAGSGPRPAEGELVEVSGP